MTFSPDAYTITRIKDMINVRIEYLMCHITEHPLENPVRLQEATMLKNCINDILLSEE